uniref:hypothetical protein n=1 Tax=Paenibacillus senegalimassiliensis TaxID=1737426 RepID=UPI000AABC849|nr:hypothetical protein [Paenibacillus senegalimassiliensis]
MVAYEDNIENFDLFVSNVKTLLATARENNIEVIYIRHDDGIGEELTKGAAGFEHGFQITIPEYTNSTVDNRFLSAEHSYKYYNEFIWNRRYANCVTMEEVLGIMNL